MHYGIYSIFCLMHFISFWTRRILEEAKCNWKPCIGIWLNHFCNLFQYIKGKFSIVKLLTCKNKDFHLMINSLSVWRNCLRSLQDLLCLKSNYIHREYPYDNHFYVIRMVTIRLIFIWMITVCFIFMRFSTITGRIKILNN